jgi:hypothetical protein
VRRFWSIVAVLGLALTGFVGGIPASEAGVGCPPPATCAVAGVAALTGILPADKSHLALYGSVVLGGNMTEAPVFAGPWGFYFDGPISVSGTANNVSGFGFLYMYDASYAHYISTTVNVTGNLSALTLKSNGATKVTAKLVKVGAPTALSAPYVGVVTLKK